MPIFTWRDEHNINVEEIDIQHQKILELVNHLHSSVEACIDKKELLSQLIELVEFTRMHFATEEKLMKNMIILSVTNIMMNIESCFSIWMIW